ncbi:MAG: MFS transporter [Solirubrobacterales bacterium]|nr:MFS transporter [Solirubrobacterales bacterium]
MSRGRGGGRRGDGALPPRLAFAALFAVTLLSMLSVGATLPILPRYVQGPIGAGDIAVGVVTGAFAITGLACRPLAGSFADSRGRKPVLMAGAALMAVASSLYFVPAGVPGLIVARLLLGAGEGMVYTAGAAWVVDIAPIERRGRILGLYGLAIWSGLSFGPPIGEILLRTSSYGFVWAFAIASPLLGAVIATRIPKPDQALRSPERAGGSFWARESFGPGAALALATVGYAALAAFVVLHLDQRGIGHGAEVFTAFAFTVVATRILAGGLPDRIGAARCAAGAAAVEAAGLVTIALAHGPVAAFAGAIAMGAAFSTIFPSLALLVINRVDDDRRGVAMGTFTACFDVGVGLGAPIAGAAAAIGGYGLSFYVAAFAALMAMAVALRLGRLIGHVAPPALSRAEPGG